MTDRITLRATWSVKYRVCVIVCHSNLVWRRSLMQSAIPAHLPIGFLGRSGRCAVNTKNNTQRPIVFSGCAGREHTRTFRCSTDRLISDVSQAYLGFSLPRHGPSVTL